MVIKYFNMPACSNGAVEGSPAIPNRAIWRTPPIGDFAVSGLGLGFSVLVASVLWHGVVWCGGAGGNEEIALPAVEIASSLPSLRNATNCQPLCLSACVTYFRKILHSNKV